MVLYFTTDTLFLIENRFMLKIWERIKRKQEMMDNQQVTEKKVVDHLNFFILISIERTIY
jgi:hypothetical protein